ncbi:MAG: LysM peptidoglycan-binding domain-containing M23 family metallopeptidase [Bacteriovoracaceae bacterium]|nr:LysM peptidoglycan-binding domain-containing M23 family metallopeptidase [Bacteriovoracaceae bacterium]
MRATFLSLILLILASCSHMKSGQHVYWSPGQSLDKIARDNGVTTEEIKELNPKLAQGHWIFVPNKIGILPFLKGTMAVEDYSGLGNGEFAWPVPSLRKVSSGFGHRWGRKHEGIDIPAAIGMTVVAVKDGRVKCADDRISGYGNMLVIEHADKVFSVYAHLSKFLVKEGETVRRGQMIAKSGNTGRSTGPHLHFEIRIRDKARDPARYLGLVK